MKKLLFFFTFCLATSLFGFTSLNEAVRYAETQPEYPSFTNKNVLNPDYTEWYLQNSPSWFNSILYKIGVKKQMWSVHATGNLIRMHLKLREKKGYNVSHAIVMRPIAGSRIILFGSLFGAFHSLVRDLKELEKQGFIDNSFKIQKPNCFFVFNGNVVDQSPYQLETLYLVLRLMEVNQDAVIYLMGKHEYAGYWQDYGLKSEILLRIGNNYHAFERDMQDFFNTLPKALFLIGDHNQKDVIRISPFAQENLPFNESSCASLIQEVKPGSITICRFHEEAKGKLSIKAFIKDEDRVINYKIHPGLLLLPAEGGATTWSIFSAPNKLYRDYFHFFFDAFTITTFGKSLADATITLYNQDVREQANFKKAAYYYLLSGESIVQPLSSTSIREVLVPSSEEEKQLKLCQDKTDQVCPKKVEDNKKPLLIFGCTLDLSKGLSGQGKLIKNGISLCVNKLNQRGGIKGRQVRVVFMDDEYSPEKARQNIEQFIKEYKSTLILCPLGSPTLQAYMDLVKENKVFVFFPVTGAPIFRVPDLKAIVHWRASYIAEGQSLTAYLINTLNIRDFAFFYQNDSYGQGALEGAHQALAKANIKTQLEVPYERNTTFFRNAIDSIKKNAVKAIGFFSTAFAATEFIRQAGVDFFIGRKICALSDLAENTFKQFARHKGLDIIIAQFAPNPTTSQLEIAKEFRESAHAQGYEHDDVFMFEGFIGANLAADILSKIEGDEITHERINSVIGHIKNYVYKGLKLDYNPKTHELAHMLWLDLGTPNWLEQKID